MNFEGPSTGGAAYISCAESNIHFRRGQNRPSRRENIRAERTARRKHTPPRPGWSHKNKRIVVRSLIFLEWLLKKVVTGKAILGFIRTYTILL